MEGKIATPKNFQKIIKAIIGIGNPDKNLTFTYHNIGHLFLDFIKKGEGWKNKKTFEYLKDKKYIFIKTLTYMNDSGIAVKEAKDYFKLLPENLLVVHDDSDIVLGEYKLQFSRGPAGHKGVASIIQHLKTKNFWRIRIGLRKKTNTKAGDIVLKKISADDLKILESVFLKLKEEIENI